MAFNGQHLRMTWKFTVSATDEIAETSLNFVGGTPPWTGAAAALAELEASDLDDFAEDLQGLMGTSGLNWADYSNLVAVKVAAISATGTYLVDPLERVLETPFDGAASNTLPQDTCCISLRTGSAVGAGVRGRMFLPHTRMTLPAGFAITSSVTRDLIAAAAATFISDVTGHLNDQVTPPMAPVIMGQTGSGTVQPILEVRCGGVTDTQRRRRNGIPELYSVQAISF